MISVFEIDDVLAGGVESEYVDHQKEVGPWETVFVAEPEVSEDEEVQGPYPKNPLRPNVIVMVPDEKEEESRLVGTKEPIPTRPLVNLVLETDGLYQGRGTYSYCGGKSS